MYIIAIAWFYVVLMMAVAEAVSAQGTILGAVVTFVLYGVLPVALLVYIMGTPARKRRMKAAEAAAMSAAQTASTEATDATDASAASAALPAAPPIASAPPDGGGVAAGDAIAAKRKEP